MQVGVPIVHVHAAGQRHAAQPIESRQPAVFFGQKPPPTPDTVELSGRSDKSDAVPAGIEIALEPSERVALLERLDVLEKKLNAEIRKNEPTLLGRLFRLAALTALGFWGGSALWNGYEAAKHGPPAQGFVTGSLEPEALAQRDRLKDQLFGKTLTTVEALSTHLATLSDIVKPAVVYISDTDRREPLHGAGSGFILSKNGLIVTNAHVVDGQKTVQVSLYDGRQVEGTVIGLEHTSDLAVVKIDADNLPSLPLADSNAVRPGELVLAVGHPKRFGWSVSLGILSGKGRAMDTYPESPRWLQTDTAINPGNSGGPLVNMRGEVIGLNSRKIAGSDTDNMGFSVTLEEIRLVLPLILRGEFPPGP
jgi:S1-C subfamily serine protease